MKFHIHNGMLYISGENCLINYHRVDMFLFNWDILSFGPPNNLLDIINGNIIWRLCNHSLTERATKISMLLLMEKHPKRFLFYYDIKVSNAEIEFNFSPMHKMYFTLYHNIKVWKIFLYHRVGSVLFSMVC